MLNQLLAKSFPLPQSRLTKSAFLFLFLPIGEEYKIRYNACMKNNYKPTVLIILDGWGWREDPTDNAIAAAQKPFFDSLWQNYPHCLLQASGEAVGLPAGQIGNSEVGHMTIGAGKTIDTDLVRISKAIADGRFASNPVFQQLFNQVKTKNSTLHVMGLIGPGGVHSYQEHLIAFLRAAKDAGVTKIAIHAFLDGRDLAPQSGAGYLKELETELTTLGIGHIATVIGRYYAMDRDQNWDRVDLALDAIARGQGEQISGQSPDEAVAAKYQQGQVDEHLKPLVFPPPTGEAETLKPDDAIFIFNFRADRVRMITKRLLDQQVANHWLLATMTEYEQSFGLPVAFPPALINTTLAKEISQASLSQAHIAETEKFAHATYFLNGGVEQAYPGENQILIESRKDVATHDQAPAMRTPEITTAAIAAIEQGTDFLFINYANADMVGHTANVPAIIVAIETLDYELKRLVTKIEAVGGVALITADHGNAELNRDPLTGAPHTAHTTNPVPCLVTIKDCALHNGTLANIANTVLRLLGLPENPTMAPDLLVSQPDQN